MRYIGLYTYLFIYLSFSSNENINIFNEYHTVMSVKYKINIEFTST